MISTKDFRKLFERVCAELSPESRAVAWDSCHASGSGLLKPSAVRAYLMLDGTRTPFLPTAAPRSWRYSGPLLLGRLAQGVL